MKLIHLYRVTLTGLLVCALSAQGQQGSNNVEQRVDSILSQMTLGEKLSYIGGTGFFDVKPIPVPVTLLNIAVQGYNSAAASVIPTSSVIQFFGWDDIGQTDQVALYEREWNNSESVAISTTAINADWSVTTVYTGTASWAPDNTAADSTGVSTPSQWQINTGTTAASVVAVTAKNIFIPSLTPVDPTFSVVLPTLSVTGTQEYIFGCGIPGAAASTITENFTGICYKLNAAGVNWRATAGTSVGANTTTTGVVVTAGSLYYLRMTLNQGWTSLNVWINHAGPTNVTTNIQTGQMFPQLILSSTVGATTKVVNWSQTKLQLYLPR